MNDTPATTGIGIIGTGVIFDAYARGLGLDPRVRVLRVADMNTERARAAAQRWSIPDAGDSAELLADDRIEVVVNITPPAAHSAVTRQALRAGKHVYVEKPLALTLEQANGDIELARELGLTLGSAPDTYLGQAGQTARAAIDAGLIGDVFAGTSFVVSSRTETWHPDPTAFYGPGGGPALDLGPYHLAHLVNLLGPVSGVLGASRRVRPELAVTSPHRRVERIPVEIASHTSATMVFENALVTAMYSFEVWDAELPHLEIYGTEGTLALPKVNRFDEPVILTRRGEAPIELTPVIPRTTPDPPTPFRALGVLDLVAALGGSAHRTSAHRALHQLEVLDAISSLDEQAGYLSIESTCTRPEPSTVPNLVS